MTRRRSPSAGKSSAKNGVINANEWRALIGMDARADEGGDDYITPLNFRMEDESGEDVVDGESTDNGKLFILRRVK